MWEAVETSMDEMENQKPASSYSSDSHWSLDPLEKFQDIICLLALSFLKIKNCKARLSLRSIARFVVDGK